MAVSPRLGAFLVCLALASPAHAQPLMVAADHSLTAAEYTAQGMPSPTRPWDEGELRRAVADLEFLVLAHGAVLRLESDISAVPGAAAASSGTVIGG